MFENVTHCSDNDFVFIVVGVEVDMKYNISKVDA